MSKNSGYAVQWIDKDGVTQRGTAYHSDQRQEFKAKNKLLVTLLNADHTFKKDGEGKIIKVLKNPELLAMKGFVD